MLKSVKALADSPDLQELPCSYAFASDPQDEVDSGTDSEDAIPIVDFSLLTSDKTDQRLRAVEHLARACQEWGFFRVINHGVPQNLVNEMIEGCKTFFDLTEEEKQGYAGTNVLDPIRYGTSFNTSVDTALCWRDYLKLIVHPEFHAPPKPSGFREVTLEYCKELWRTQCELVRAVSESLGLGEDYMTKVLDLEKNGTQIFAANLYPPCPRPEAAVGIPPHSDHGILTFLIDNGVHGLRIQHNGKWAKVNSKPGFFLVNVCDQLEVLSNGRYKSILHSAVVNNSATRISIATVIGPSMDRHVRPAAELMKKERHASFMEMTYRDYLITQQSNKLDGKSCLDRIRITTQ